jgi:hypothetical protein
MVMRIKTKRRLRLAISLSALVIVGGIAFVTFFMHVVYEAEECLDPLFVPLAVRRRFGSRFPGARAVKWKHDENVYEAQFHWEGQDEVEAYFTASGDWSRTEFPVPFEDLPEKARQYLAAQSFKTVAVERIEATNGAVAYEAEIGNWFIEWDCIFDAEGNLISKTRDGSVLEE